MDEDGRPSARLPAVWGVPYGAGDASLYKLHPQAETAPAVRDSASKINAMTSLARVHP
jgi:hypothetical protein